jgi:hypothetical protein
VHATRDHTARCRIVQGRCRSRDLAIKQQKVRRTIGLEAVLGDGHCRVKRRAWSASRTVGPPEGVGRGDALLWRVRSPLGHGCAKVEHSAGEVATLPYAAD